MEKGSVPFIMPAPVTNATLVFLIHSYLYPRSVMPALYAHLRWESDVTGQIEYIRITE